MAEPTPRETRVAIIGRPNVGKSTLLNALTASDRAIVSSIPGTTRDAVEIDFERSGKRYTLIDTAGMRRRGRVTDAVEKFSVIKTLQAISDANVVVLVLDARTGADVARWPVSVSYFDPTKADGSPNYVLGFDLYDNGVSGKLRIDYGSYTLNGVMSKFEALPQKPCER
mgnify:CR=1 FL=1